MSKKSFDSSNELDFNALQSSSNARLNVPVTIYRGVHPQPLKYITLKDLLFEMASDDITKISATTAIVDSYEKYLSDAQKGIEGAKKPYEDKKTQLNGFSLGEFSYRNDKKENCLQYVPCFVFDLDGCKSKEETSLLQQKITNLPYIFAAFPSPGGHGLRVFIWISSTYEKHRILYMQALKTLCKDLAITTDKKNGVHFDSTCQNESRFFYYVAVAPKNFYLNLESNVFEYTPIPELKQVAKGAKLPQKKEDSANYTYIDAITEDVKIEFILKSIDMNKPRKLQCFDFGCLCCENQVDFNKANLAAQQHFYDTEQKNPEKVITKQLKDGYDQTSAKWTDEQFAGYLRKKYNIQVAKKQENPKNESAKPIHIKKVDMPDLKEPLQNEAPNTEQSVGEWRKAMAAINVSSNSKMSFMKRYLLELYQFRRNIVANTIEYALKQSNLWENLNENDLICELMEENFTGVEKMLRAFMGSSMIPDWDPFVDYFENLPEWDGIDHIQQLANFVETDDKIWWDLMFRKALVRQVACATGVIHYNKQCVVLCGVTNNGKSKYLRFLIPKRLSKYITENPDFSQSGNKDAKLSVAKNFQIILEELGNFGEKELKAVKSQMSSEYVNERLLYDRNNTFMYRKATFWGNTDKEDFLTDPQGNVRFVVIQVKNINHDEGGKKGYNQNVNMDNVWAQAYHLLKNGYIYHLTKAEIEKSEANNTTEYMKVSKEEELIVKYFKPANKRTDGAVFKTTTDITIYLEQISRNISNWKVGAALKKLKWERFSIPGGSKGYFVVEYIK